MTNQYHEDDSIDEMLEFLDNGIDLFAKHYDDESILDKLQVAFDWVVGTVREKNPEGLKLK